MPEQFTFIPDGYNLRAKIGAVAGLHGEIEFYYRPMLRRERAALVESIRRAADPVKQSDLEASDLVGRLVRWSVPLPITVDGLDQIPESLYRRILNIVWGAEQASELDAVSPDEIERFDEAATEKN